MKNQRELDAIKDIITKHTAIEYADLMIEKERSKGENDMLIYNSKTGAYSTEVVPYKEYMQNYWGNSKDTLEKCVQNSYVSKLNRYSKCIELYSGWIDNGKLFVLHKREKLITFLYKVEKDSFKLNAKPKNALLYIHYNPLDVDFIETSVRHEYLFNGLVDDIWSEEYDISADEEMIIKELEKIIDGTKVCL